MKRSITNKLMSALCFTALMTSLNVSISNIFRVFTHGLPLQLALAFVLSQIFGVLLTTMNFIGVFTFKILRLLTFYFANQLDEDFWFFFYEIFSISTCLVLTSLEAGMADTPMPLAQVIAGNHPWQSTSMVRILFGLIGVSGFVTLFGHTCLSIWKKSTTIVEALPTNNNFNVLVYNPAILNDLQVLAVTIFFILTASFPFILQRGQPPETADQLFLLWMPLRLWLGVLTPFLFYGFNKELRAYSKREFWDAWAPNFLQKYNPNLITIPSTNRNRPNVEIEMTPVQSFP